MPSPPRFWSRAAPLRPDELVDSRSAGAKARIGAAAGAAGAALDGDEEGEEGSEGGSEGGRGRDSSRPEDGEARDLSPRDPSPADYDGQLVAACWMLRDAVMNEQSRVVCAALQLLQQVRRVPL